MMTTLVVMALTFLALLAAILPYTATVQVLLEQRKEKIFGSDSVMPDLNLESGATSTVKSPSSNPSICCAEWSTRSI